MYAWDSKKNAELIKEGRPSFDDIFQAIRNGNLLDSIPNPVHARQKILVVRYKSEIYAVPMEYRQGGELVWLITVYPSRKLRKAYGK